MLLAGNHHPKGTTTLATTVKNTTLEFGLVSLEVALKKASAKQDVKLDRATADGHPIKRIEVDSETGEKIDPESIIQRGVREGEEFFPIPEAELALIEAASEEALPALEVEEFIPKRNIPTDRVVNAYFVVPQKDSGSARGLKYLLRALTKTKRAGIVRFLLRSREYLGAVHAEDGRLVLSVLAFADDFAAAQTEAENLIEQGGKVDPKAVKLTCDLIQGMAGDGSVLNEASDEQVAEKRRLVEEARQGKAVKPKKGKVKPAKQQDGLAAALEASVTAVRERVPA